MLEDVKQHTHPQDDTIDLSIHFKRLAEKWPSTFVARDRISEFTGGLVSPGRIANLDSQGEGPPNRFRVGRKVCYPVSGLTEWLQARAQRI